MKPDFVTAEVLLDILDKDSSVISVIVNSDAPSLELLSNLDKVETNLPIYVVLLSSIDEAKLLQVIKVPQIRFYKNGNEVKTHVGSPTLNDLKTLITEFK